MLYNFTSYLLSYNLRFNKPYRRRVKFLSFKKSLSLKLLRSKMVKKDYLGKRKEQDANNKKHRTRPSFNNRGRF